MNSSLLLRLTVCMAFYAGAVTSFASPNAKRNRDSLKLYSKKTLTPETTWKLRFNLNGLPTEKGKKVDEMFVVYAKFREEEGYEPPQGDLIQISPEEEGNPLLEFGKSRWQLSEDPEDRKDGLWVWGLFAEPLYPFLILSLETSSIPLPGEDGDAIKPLKLYAQIDHKRDEAGATLGAAQLNVREIENIKADPFGVSMVDVYEEKGVGQLSIQAL